MASDRPWPADRVERRPLAALSAYARNARTHSPEQIDQIAASMQEFGFTIPVLIDPAGEIIAGHGRVLAASKLGYGEVPVMIAEGWSDAQKRAYVIADNQLALNAGWNEALLSTELIDLRAVNFDLGLLGFDNDRLFDLTTPAPEVPVDPESTPEPPTNPVSRLGDIWTLGTHRIICGDSTDAATVERLLAGAKPHLMVTDPPYGVDYNADWRNKAMRSNGTADGGRAIGKVENDDRSDWREAWELFPGDVAYVWTASLHAHQVAESLISEGFKLKTSIIWAKDRMQISRGDYHWQHEPCWYASRGKSHWVGGRKQTSLWDIKLPWDNYGNRKPQKGDEKNPHSTQKPIECMKRPMENNSRKGDAVYEPFSGSGTTIIAGEITKRRVFAVELSPAYVDVAVRRWQEFTGKEAVHGDGRNFAQIAAERAA